MRLFKCYDKYAIDCPDQVIVVFAENEKKALRKVADIHKKLDVYETPVKTVLNNFKVEEIFAPKECNAYVAYSRDMSSVDDVQIVFVPFEVQDIESYIMDQLIEAESQEELFREFVIDKGINMSFNEMFYCDDKGWIFSYEPPLRLREDIEAKLMFEDISEGEFIDEFWLTSVSKFFEDKYYFKQFFEYITTNSEADFDEGFFFYVCKKLMKQGDWTVYEDLREVEY
ncbi:hypothetical protein [Mesobacillus sp. S13]|uniref:hypothetical protein n=1 Tax=Mesobacillus sp. S13 TaxID=2880221 RepID=UPI001CF5DE0E|nr:hypothetical protein [Mesobacillus sp. S13]